MQKTTYDIDKLQHILQISHSHLPEWEKAAYYAASNVLSQNLLVRLNDMQFSSIAAIEDEMKDFMWHLNTMLGFAAPVITREEHYEKATSTLERVRRHIQEKKVINFMYAGQQRYR